MKFFRKIIELSRIADLGEIARRYFVLNTFDGILTIIGILAAAFFTAISEAKVIIIACLGAITAIAISGFFGAYYTERAEREGKLKRIERHIGMSLKKTPITRAYKFAIFLLSAIEGFSPALAGIVIISPFFFFDVKKAFFGSFVISAILLFLIGIFLGKISKERLLTSGLKMLLIGIVCAAIIFVIEHFTRI